MLPDWRSGFMRGGPAAWTTTFRLYLHDDIAGTLFAMGETTPHRYLRVTSPKLRSSRVQEFPEETDGTQEQEFLCWRFGLAAAAMTVASGVKANDSVVKAVSDPNGWAIAGHDYGNTRFSPLKQITSENVGKLQLAYSLSLASLRSNESSPVVIGDTLYVTTSWGPKYVYAINAATWAKKWIYEPDIPDDVLQYACAATSTTAASPMRMARSSSAGWMASSRRSMPRAARSFGRRRSSTTSWAQ